MLGAVLGDIIGSRFEFDRGPWTKEFELITEESEFTDDSVMTAAVAEALIPLGKNPEETDVKKNLISSMKKWGKRYPHAGYGYMFSEWLASDDQKPYGSYGNGSAMRVSPVGWLYDDITTTRKVARWTAEVTHDHPEGIKGAECTAAVIFLARSRWCKTDIQDYVEEVFGYTSPGRLEDVRKNHRHDESCMDTLPKAILSFFNGHSLEDVIRNAVSLGGDTDTIAAVAGAMAEAFYGIDENLRKLAFQNVSLDIAAVMSQFENITGRTEKNSKDSTDLHMDVLAEIARRYSSENDAEMRLHYTVSAVNALVVSMISDVCVPMPFVDTGNVLSIDTDKARLGDKIVTEKELKLVFDTMKDKEGKLYIPLFTSMDELKKGRTANVIMSFPVKEIVASASKRKDVEGLVINPFGQSMVLTREICRIAIEAYKKKTSQDV